jgi:hypothetical protein
MSEAKQSRDERLAAKLRENLRRRKDQARQITGAAIAAESESPDLPKPPPRG